MPRLFSTEQVSKYHPDKACDQVSDALLTAYLRADPNSHCGIETMWKGRSVVLGGEITSAATVNKEDVVRQIGRKLGYPIEDVVDLTTHQSREIQSAVDSIDTIGAGDQGMMFGYASRESSSYLPYGFDIANQLISILEVDTALNYYLKGDAKVQVTVDLDKHGIDSLHTIVISACHHSGCTLHEVREHIDRLLYRRIDLGKAKLLINPAGAWAYGGPEADCGLTGRKIVADQYGGYCAVGGGAFSGKDPTKVDRSASYMARKIAIDMLDKYDLAECRVQLAYAIGVSEPVGVYVDYVNPKPEFSVTGMREQIIGDIRSTYDLTPKGIIDTLGLRSKSIDYSVISQGCHYRNGNVL